MMILNPYRYASAGNDPHYASVVSLLRFGGADGSTAFTDEKGVTWAANGGAQIDTSLGYNAGQFDGTGDFLSTTNAAGWQISADFCTEAWIVTSTNSSARVIAAKRDSGANENEWQFFISATGKLQFIAWAAGGASVVINLTGTTTLTTGVLHHAEIDRSGSNFYLFLNGALEASGTQTATPGTGTYTPRIGRNNGTTNDWNGWIRQFRHTKGVARHTSGFTPPTVPFPNS